MERARQTAGSGRAVDVHGAADKRLRLCWCTCALLLLYTAYLILFLAQTGKSIQLSLAVQYYLSCGCLAPPTQNRGSRRQEVRSRTFIDTQGEKNKKKLVTIIYDWLWHIIGHIELLFSVPGRSQLLQPCHRLVLDTSASHIQFP